jgi:hypothetical protein
VSKAPEVLQNEDGDRWFVPGCLSEPHARLALAVFLAGPRSEMDDDDAYDTALTASYSTGWLRWPSDDAESMVPCGPDDEGTEQFTVLSS